jgi:hypothetical protein
MAGPGETIGSLKPLLAIRPWGHEQEAKLFFKMEKSLNHCLGPSQALPLLWPVGGHPGNPVGQTEIGRPQAVFINSKMTTSSILSVLFHPKIYESWPIVTGKSHDQADAEWIVIRTQLRGINNMPFGQPAPGRPFGRPGSGRSSGVFCMF